LSNELSADGSDQHPVEVEEILCQSQLRRDGHNELQSSDRCGDAPCSSGRKTNTDRVQGEHCRDRNNTRRGVGVTGDADTDRVDRSNEDEHENRPTVPYDQRKPCKSDQDQFPLPPHPSSGIAGDHHDDQGGGGEQCLVVILPPRGTQEPGRRPHSATVSLETAPLNRPSLTGVKVHQPTAIGSGASSSGLTGVVGAGTSVMRAGPSIERCGNTRSSQEGRNQLRLPHRPMTAGSKVIRTRSTSTKTATARPTPNSAVTRWPDSPKLANTHAMMPAAVRMTGPVSLIPTAIARLFWLLLVHSS